LFTLLFVFCQTLFLLDPTLVGTLQHRWMRNKTNIKSEANWSVFRRDFTPGFESVLDLGVNNGWYDVNHALEKYVNGYCNESWISFTFSFSLVFRWLAIPWLQAEVDR